MCLPCAACAALDRRACLPGCAARLAAAGMRQPVALGRSPPPFAGCVLETQVVSPQGFGVSRCCSELLQVAREASVATVATAAGSQPGARATPKTGARGSGGGKPHASKRLRKFLGKNEKEGGKRVPSVP